jgi:hypothetical protein
MIGAYGDSQEHDQYDHLNSIHPLVYRGVDWSWYTALDWMFLPMED